MTKGLARLIVRLSAWMAPSALRARWREEWLAEIDREAPAGAPSPLVRALGAPIDAIRAPRSAAPKPGAAYDKPGGQYAGRSGFWSGILPSWLDFRMAIRATQASPVVSVTAILALAVGIALATAAFTVVHSVLYSELRAPGGDQILGLRDYDRVGRYGLLITLEEHERRRRALTSYIDLAAYRVRTDDVTFERGHEIRRVTSVTPNLFSVLGVDPIHGRAFDAKDGEPGAAPVVLIREAVARAHGLAPANAVGRQLLVRGERHDVVGVIPDTCQFPFATEIWIPVRDQASGGMDAQFSVVARARPDLDLDAAAAELRVIASQIPPLRGEQRDQRVVPFAAIVADDDGAAVGWAIVGGLVLLLLVAAANVANLLLARTAARQREVAIRAALGASRGRVVAAIAIEAAVLAGVAAALGLAGARAALVVFQNSVDDMPYWMRLDLDVPVFLFAVLVAALASIVAGVGPALKVTRGALVDTLRTGHATLRFGRLSAAITMVEAALAVGLLSGAASFAQSLVGFNYQSYRLPEDRVAIAQLYFSPPDEITRQTDRDVQQAQWKAFSARVQQERHDLAERVLALPGVRMVAYAWHFPGADRMNVRFEIQGHPVVAGVPTRHASVGDGFFALLGARITAGRDFTRDDVDQNRPVAIVNEPFARKYFGDASPIGRRLRITLGGPEQPWREIVGVVPDLGLNPGDPSRADGIYVPLGSMNVLRVAWLTDGNPLALAPAVHEAVRQLPLQPRVQWSHTLATNLAESASIFRGIGWGFIALGVVALVMTCTAIHAIVAFSLAQRRRELAVRLALGAGGRGVVRALLGRTARQLAAGAVLGALLALAINLLIDELPMDVPRAGFWRPAGTMALIMIAGLTACAGPLRRALALRPLDWLRE